MTSILFLLVYRKIVEIEFQMTRIYTVHQTYLSPSLYAKEATFWIQEVY